MIFPGTNLDFDFCNILFIFIRKFVKKSKVKKFFVFFNFPENVFAITLTFFQRKRKDCRLKKESIRFLTSAELSTIVNKSPAVKVRQLRLVSTNFSVSNSVT